MATAGSQFYLFAFSTTTKTKKKTVKEKYEKSRRNFLRPKVYKCGPMLTIVIAHHLDDRLERVYMSIQMGSYEHVGNAKKTTYKKKNNRPMAHQTLHIDANSTPINAPHPSPPPPPPPLTASVNPLFSLHMYIHLCARRKML